MKKYTLLKFVNIVIAVLFLALAITGIGGYFLPSPAVEFHQWLGYLFAAAVIAHLALNWGWIQSNFFKGKKSLPSAKA